MRKLFGTVLQDAVTRKINNLRLAAGQMSNGVKRSLTEQQHYSNCTDCGRPLTSTEVYGQWEDYCIDCYIEEDSNEK